MEVFEKIKAANESIQTIGIERTDKRTGKVTKKDYAEVNQRIKAFRMVYPQGSITTEMLSNADGVCVFRAVVRDEQGRMLSTGTAYEKESSSFINQTSYIENCETSAVGRALGMAGFGIDTSVASYEEVRNAQLNQDAKITKAQKAVIEKKYTGEALQRLLDWAKVPTLDDMTADQATKVINQIKEREK